VSTADRRTMAANDSLVMTMTETELRAALLILNGTSYPPQVHDALADAAAYVVGKLRQGGSRH